MNDREEPVRVLLVSGSLRAGSTNTAVLRTVSAIAPDDVETSTYEALGLLPHYNPDDDPEGGPVDQQVATLRAALHAADAVLICTPEYAGALPGSFKNLLEWTVGDASTYNKPVAWINSASIAAPTGGADAHESLRKVLGYVGADIVEDAITRLPISRDAIDDGLVADPNARAHLAGVINKLVAHVRSAP